jgi:hypothetical protein
VSRWRPSSGLKDPPEIPLRHRALSIEGDP